MARKLIIEINVEQSDFEDGDVEKIVEFSQEDWAAVINVEMGGMHTDPASADQGICQQIVFSSEYFKIRLEE